MKKPSYHQSNRVSKALFATSFMLLATEANAVKEYIVKLKTNPRHYNFEQLASSSHHAFKVAETAEAFNMVKISAAVDENKQDPIKVLNNYFNADYVVENSKVHAFIDDSDPRRSEQWALNTINANKAWDISAGSHNVVVAVIDTGSTINHEDLKDNIWVNIKEIPNNNKDDDNNGYIDDVNGWDFQGKDKDPSDETSYQNPGHGTHCSGIIGAECGNHLGVCGISPTISIMPLRFLDKNGSGDLFDSIKAIEYAMNNGAHVISASWGAAISRSDAQPIIDAIVQAEQKGLTFVVAASNDGKSNDSYEVYPANSGTPNIISVAASNSSDQKPSWSNYGRKVDLAAPGEDILSTIPGGYDKLSGTSMATPYVAGTVALMKSVDISLTGAQARSILQSTGAAVDIQTASNTRIDAQSALNAVVNKTLTVVPAAATFAINDTFEFSAWGGAGSYTFASLNPDIATIDENGHLEAKAVGDVVIEVTDGAGNKAQSVSIKVSDGSGGGGGGGDGECPIDNDFLCAIICIIDPTQPWCQGGGLPFPVPTP